jgi:outer membrane lipoprotein SlyB
MALSIQDILLASAQKKESEQISPEAASVLGALAGAGVGFTAGRPMQALRQMKSDGIDALAKREGLTVAPRQRIKDRMRPGPRLAGGLVGLILGGALGAGTRNLMMQNSPEAQMIAKIQSGGDFTQADQIQLEKLLANAYSNTLGMG